MNIYDLLKTPGEHAFMANGVVGELEVALNVPDDTREHLVAVIGHPHSLFGGTMSNKVVTTTTKAFNALNIPSLRFNFRGVGKSEGVFDNGIGESEDMLKLVALLKEANPQSKFIFAGFSFGSFVAYRASAQHEHKMLITIAPPIERFDYQAYSKQPNPWLIIQGEADDVVDPQGVIEFATQNKPVLGLVRFKDTGHFFHGKLIELKECLIEKISLRVIEL